MIRATLRILALPFTSETIATAIGGLGFTMAMIPFLYYVIAIKLTEMMSHVALLSSALSPVPMMIASVSLRMGSPFRSYRDNSGSRAGCEFFSLVFFVMALVGLRINTM